MINTIDKTHPIFCSTEYLKDIVPFNLMEIIRQFPMLLVSNEKDFIVGMTSPQTPIWVWTAETIDSDSLVELREYFYNEFSAKSPVCFVAKPRISTFLVEPFIKNKHATEHRIGMESFENTEIIPAKDKSVVIENPIDTDVEAIALCMSNFEKECFGRNVSAESLFENAKNKLNNPYFFVIKEKGIVVATAQSSRETDTHIAINRVYTSPEYRGNGYAAALVAYISELILAKGKIPALYTDLSNPSSNKAYKNIGFVEKGKVDETTLSWD